MTDSSAAGARIDVAVLGAGPVGLDAALAATERGLSVTVYEQADGVAGHVRSWGHVRLFSPWSMNVSERMRRELVALGEPLEVALDGTPTGAEFVDRVLEPVGRGPALRGRIRFGTRVMAVGREGTLKHEEIGTGERARRPFRLLLRDAEGHEFVEHASVLLDCTGKYGNPNTLGDGGIPAPGEERAGAWIVRRIPDVTDVEEVWAGRTILLAGAGHSAQTAARALGELAAAQPGTRIVWAVRAPAPDWGAVPDDPLPRRAELAAWSQKAARGEVPGVELRAGVVVDGLEPLAAGGVRVRLRRNDGETDTLEADRIVSLTGGVGDHSLYRQLQVHECYATSGPMKLAAALLGEAGGGADCLTQESHGVDTLLNPEPNFFLLGDKSYGRNSTFLLRIGYQQVDEVFEALAR